MFHEGDRIIPLARIGDMSHGQLEVAVVLLLLLVDRLHVLYPL